jgi:hypothetical protein
MTNEFKRGKVAGFELRVTNGQEPWAMDDLVGKKLFKDYSTHR